VLECAREPDPLKVAPRQHSRANAFVALELELGDRTLDGVGDAGCRQAAQERCDRQIGANFELGVGERLIHEVPDARPSRRVDASDVAPLQSHRARIWVEHPQQQAHQRGLARPVQTHERVHFPGRDGHVEAPHSNTSVEQSRESPRFEEGRRRIRAA
jgi:hypothetical protein